MGSKDDDSPHFKLRTQRFQSELKHRQLEKCTWFEDRPTTLIPVGTDPSQDRMKSTPAVTPLKWVLHIEVRPAVGKFAFDTLIF
jgi:hypothetical protein